MDVIKYLNFVPHYIQKANHILMQLQRYKDPQRAQRGQVICSLSHSACLLKDPQLLPSIPHLPPCPSPQI